MPDLSIVALKLREYRERAGFTQAQLAAELNWTTNAYQHYERRYKRPFLPVELVRELTPILVGRGVAEEDIAALAGGEGGHHAAPGPVVRGALAAGDWRARLDWPGADRYTVTLPRSVRFRGLPATTYGLEVADESCNLVCAEGGVLICVPLDALDRPLRHGEAVILVTAQADLFERRCMTASADPHGGILLSAPTDQPALRSAVPIQPPRTRGTLQERQRQYTADDALAYDPAVDDTEYIAAAVFARIAPY